MAAFALIKRDGVHAISFPCRKSGADWIILKLPQVHRRAADALAFVERALSRNPLSIERRQRAGRADPSDFLQGEENGCVD